MTGLLTSILGPGAIDTERRISLYSSTKGKSDDNKLVKHNNSSDCEKAGVIDIEIPSTDKSLFDSFYPHNRPSNISIEKPDPSVHSVDRHNFAQKSFMENLLLNNDIYKKLLDREQDKNRTLATTIEHLRNKIRAQAQQKELAELRLQQCLLENSSQTETEESIHSDYKRTPQLMLSQTYDDYPQHSNPTQYDNNCHSCKYEEETAAASESMQHPSGTTETHSHRNLQADADTSPRPGIFRALEEVGVESEPEKQTSAIYKKERCKSFFLDNASDISLTSSAIVPYIVPCTEEKVQSGTGDINGAFNRVDMSQKLAQYGNGNYLSNSDSWRSDTNLKKQRTKSLMTRKSSVRLSSMQLDFSKRAHRKSAVIGEHLVEVDTKSVTDTREILNAAHRQSLVSLKNLKTYAGEPAETTLGSGTNDVESEKINFNIVPISKPNKDGAITRAQPALTAPTVSCRVRRSFNTPLGGLREEDNPNPTKASSNSETFLDDFEEDTKHYKSPNKSSGSAFHQHKYMKKNKKPVLLGRASVTAYRN